jgi:O-antigen/teichoic acid export membrane protein
MTDTNDVQPATVVAPSAQRLAKQMVLSALANLAPPAAGFAVAPLLAQALGAEQRGIVAAATAPLLLMTTVAMFGIPEAVTYLIARDPSNARQALKKGLLLLVAAGLVATGAILLLAGPLSGNNPRAEELIRIAGLFVLPTTLVSGIRALPRGLHEWHYVNQEKYITSATRLIFLFGAFSIGTLSPLGAVLVLSMAPVIGGFAFLRPLLRLRSKTNSQPVRLREITSFSLVVWLGSVSGIILGKIDQAIMLPLSDAKQLGYYAAAASVGDAVLVINNAVRDISFSAQSSGSDPSVLQRSARISFLAGLAMSSVIILPISFWFPLLFGHDFAPAIPVVVILTIAAVIGIPGSVAGAGLVGRGRPGAVSTSLILAAAVNVFAVIALVPPLGAVGAAVATLAGNVIASNLNIIVLKRIYSVPMLGFYLIRPSDFRAILRLIKRLGKK